jgi:cell division septum initiation protein DivIVA
MRNIKITALLLAVLMIVAAFAGCASKSTVSNLDNKVNDLDGKLQEQANALTGIQDSLKDLADAIGNQGSSSELDDIKKDVEENKQNVADILEAIEGLKDAVAGATGESEDVKTAINQAGAKIDALKGDFEDNKAHYTAEDIAAIRAIFGTAQASISTCVTAEAVAAVLAAMDADLAKHVRVDDALYAYVVELEGNITDASAAKVEEAMAALEKAIDFYEDAPEALEEYEVAEDETINLVDAIEDLYEAQTETLETIKLAAKELVKDIDAAVKEYNVTTLYALKTEYKAWKKAAEKLSAENVALVTNVEKLDAALDSAENVVAATSALKNDNTYDSFFGDATGTLFADYEALVDECLQGVYALPDEDGKLVKLAGMYKEIDARIAEFKADNELTDEALDYVISSVMEDEEFLTKYEADKAVAAKFAAEYETLSKGVFADIKALNAKKVSAANALDLVNAFKANAKAINDWKDALIAAYKADYEKLENPTTVTNYTVEFYEEILVPAVFNVMVYEAELGEYDYDADSFDFDDYYGYGFATTADANKYFLALYDFSKNEKTEEFLTVTFPAVEADAKTINDRINALPENQQVSIVAMATQLGGYVELSADGKKLEAIEEIEVDDTVTTIAEFVAKYEDLGLAGMVNVELYEKKLAAVEAIVAKAETNIKALMDAYAAIRGNKSAVLVTMDNVAAIKALDPLLVNWVKTGRTDMVKATVADTVAGVKEYKLVGILDEYKALYGDNFAADFLNATDYSATKYDADDADATVDTGMILRLVDQAKNLEKEANIAVTAWKMVAQLNAANGGKAFQYANINDGATIAQKLYDGSYDNIKTYGYFMGVLSYAVKTKEVKSGTATVTKYDADYSFVRFTRDRGFYNGSYAAFATKNPEGDYTGYASESAALTAAGKNLRVNYLWDAPVELTDVAAEKKQIFIDWLFAMEWSENYSAETAAKLEDQKTLAGLIATTDVEALTAYDNKAIPAYALPMFATYFETKFMVNNMGQAYAALETAKNGWGTAGSNYGFDWIKGMTVNFLRTNAGANLSTSALAAIGATLDLTELTVAVNANLEGVDFAQNIEFGHGDATWISGTYDLGIKKYADGGFKTLDVDRAALYAEHGVDLSKFEVTLLTVYKAERLPE